MACAFNGSNQFLDPGTVPSALVSPSAYTASAWVNPDALTAAMTATAVSDTDDSDAAADFARVAVMGNVGGDPVRAQFSTGGLGNVDDQSSASAGAWQHTAAVFQSGSSVEAFLAGSGDGSTLAAATPSNMDTISIGALRRTSTGQYFDGLIAEVAWWSVALSDAEIASLAAGACPLLIRPGSLVFYLPMRGGEGFVDVVGGLDMGSNNGGNDPTATHDHPPIIYPSRPRYVPPTAAAGSGSPERSYPRGLHRGLLRGAA